MILFSTFLPEVFNINFKVLFVVEKMKKIETSIFCCLPLANTRFKLFYKKFQKFQRQHGCSKFLKYSKFHLLSNGI